MGIFSQNPFSRPSTGSGPSNHDLATLSSGYRRFLAKHPFAAFGLPFIVTMVAGSFFLTPATAVRYEKFDRKTHIVDRDTAFSMGFKNLGPPSGVRNEDPTEGETRPPKKAGGKFKNKDIREEYWKLAGRSEKLDDWEPVRVKRLPGEPDGTFD